MDRHETIYDLIERPKPKERKPKMHRSKYPGKLPPSASTFGATSTAQVLATNYGGDVGGPAIAHKFKKSAGNFGPLKVAKPDPKRYMKKKAGHPALAKPKKFDYKDPVQKRQPVPKRGEKPVMGLVSTKNFVKTNAIDTILSHPPKEATEKRFNGEAEGEGVGFRHAEHAKVPEYLRDVKKEIRYESEFLKHMFEQRKDRARVDTNVKMLDAGDREHLLYALKKKWQEVNAQYQLHTHETVLDTIGKLRRKEDCEAELKQLAADIEKLSTTYVFTRE